MSLNLKPEIIKRPIEQELKTSYIDYAMNVIVSRALPDVRDGLKPVQRRIIYAMKLMGNTHDKPHKKSARVVGDVIGKYHPHGDIVVYEAIVRMAQNFAYRYPLIEGQGNFGSIDGDSPAAMRYTGMRMAPVGTYLIEDLDKDTVTFSLNYDESELMPDILPAKIPNLLLNGASGIAVGMATNIPPHNLTEVIDAIIYVASYPDTSLETIMEFIKGPDFPTGAQIYGDSGIKEAYSSGRGTLTIRARHHLEDNGRTIVFTDIPYQMNKSHIVENIANLVNSKKIEGIAHLRDESDKEGIRIVIELKKHANPDVVLNNLYEFTRLQSYYHMNMVALSQNSPKLFTLKDIIDEFIAYRSLVMTKRAQHILNKSKYRLHILEGFSVAIENIEILVPLIKKSANISDAKTILLNTPFLCTSLLKNKKDHDLPSHLELEEKYGLIEDHASMYQLSSLQVSSILELKLTRLTGLEQNRLANDSQDLIMTIKEQLSLLEDKSILLKKLCDELLEIKRQNSDPRRTEIISNPIKLQEEDLISPEKMIISLSKSGYVKIQSLENYNIQKRGGTGKIATTLKEADSIEQLIVASRRDTLLCFSNKGRVYWKKVYKLPEGDRTSKGKPINNFLALETDEYITALLPLSNYLGNYVFYGTKKGIVKKTLLASFSKPRVGGIKSIELDQGDELAHLKITSGEHEIMLFSNSGKVVRFGEKDVRPIGRLGRGVKGMTLKDDEQIVAMIAISPMDHNLGHILTVTEKGYGKRTEIQNYRKTRRGSKGVISISVSKRNGIVVDSVFARPKDNMILITEQGVITRIDVESIRIVGRTAQGVKLMHLKKDKITDLSIVENDLL